MHLVGSTIRNLSRCAVKLASNINNVWLTPDLSTQLMDLLADYHQAVTVWLSPACYTRTLALLYFSTIFAIYILWEFSGFRKGAAETSSLLGYCALSPSVFAQVYKEEFFIGPRIVNISVFKLIYANISLYFVPVRYLYGLLLCCVLIAPSYSNIFTHKLNSVLRIRTVQQHVIIPYPTAFPYGNGMVLHFYQQQESSTTKTVHRVINKGLKTYV